MLFKKIAKAGFAAASCIAATFPLLASAHENYVLTKAQIDMGMADWSINVWKSLTTPGNILVALKFGAGFIAVYVIYFFFQRSRWGAALDRWMRKREAFGDVLLRVVLGISLIFSAHVYSMTDPSSHSFLGPEIPLSSIPGGHYLTPILYILGLLMVFGLFSRIAGAAAMLIIILATFVYKDYMLTYFNYFGEFTILFLFGSYVFSLDRLFDAKRVVSHKIRQWEALIIRVTYGISILYPAISIKILHPIIIVEIVKQYHMTDIHWLFPSDPLLISLGTGLTQIVVGLALIVGFETRLNSMITFALYVMSILFFKEAVWPHYILLALSLSLFINDGGDWTLDRWIQKKWPGRSAPPATQPAVR